MSLHAGLFALSTLTFMLPEYLACRRHPPHTPAIWQPMASQTHFRPDERALRPACLVTASLPARRVSMVSAEDARQESHEAGSRPWLLRRRDVGERAQGLSIPVVKRFIQGILDKELR